MATSARLAGAVAVITGGNRGIGRAIAFEIARAGADVVLAARDSEHLRTARDAIADQTTRVITAECDVANPADMERLADRTHAEFGRADVVVACAGVAGPVKYMHEIAPAEWRDCVSIDLDGVFYTFRPFIPGMVERGSGCLIAISSMTGKRPLAQRTPYAAAKLGVIGLVRSLAEELGPHGVRVNSVVPGAVSGPRLERVIRMIADEEEISEDAARERFTANAALRRAVRPEEVATTCVFLASDEGAGITGEDVNVTAGLVMY